MAKTFRGDFGLSSGRIVNHRDGTATLIVTIAGKKYKSTHRNEKAAVRAWYRWNS